MPNIADIVEVAEALETKAIFAVTEKCVAVRNRNSKCQKCVEACTVGAIEVKKNKFSVDASLCIGCGSCSVACPTEAIVALDPTDEVLARDVASAVKAADGICVIACARVASHHKGDPDKFAAVPCLARVDESILLEIVAAGVEQIVLVDGNCSTCKHRKCVPGFEKTIASANNLLDLQGSAVHVTRSSEFPENVLAVSSSRSYGAARRSFFSAAGDTAKSAAKVVAEQTVSSALGAKKEGEKSLRDLFAVTKTGALPQFEAGRHLRILDAMDAIGSSSRESIDTRLFGSVEIDEEKCRACYMCTVFCPTGALVRSEEELGEGEGSLLEFSLAECVQCQLCANACLKKCLTVHSVISTEELFDFEPRMIHLPEPPSRRGITAGFNPGGKPQVR